MAQALLTAALDHYWAWYDGRSQRAFQILNYYLVGTAILLAAYTSAINGNHDGIAAAIAAAGLRFTVLTALSELYEVYAASLAEVPLTELRSRVTGRLGIDATRITAFHGQIAQQRRVGIALTFGLSAVLDISALLYAAIG